MKAAGDVLLLLLMQTLIGWTASQLRVVNPNSNCSGRVEVFLEGQWGTVCDDNWDILDAEVVCRQLGCGKALSAHVEAFFLEGSGPIWLDEVQCVGSEQSLTDCPYTDTGDTCAHEEDASVICEEIGFDSNSPDLPPPSDAVRLVNSSDRCSGRVEVFYNRQWGTVCDDGWDRSDADIVCLQLGCGIAIGTYYESYFGNGYGPIWLDEIQCSGNESTITDCANAGAAINDCDHDEDAGVTCRAAELRLAGTSDRCSGRVEIYHDGQWGTVCDDFWNMDSAQVVCNQLGCGKALSANYGSYFGEGVGPIWLDDIYCGGNELLLRECSHSGFGINNCDHTKDAGVVCGEFQVRVVNPNSNCSGRVEIFHLGEWGTVCEEQWDINDAEVVCRQLGCGKALSAHDDALFGEGSGRIWLTYVDCLGSEESITDCDHGGAYFVGCRHEQDASIICEEIGFDSNSPDLPPPSDAVRLVNSNDRCSGRVEVFYNRQWGTVCDDSWSTKEANVVCQQLGCGIAMSVYDESYFGNGYGPIWMDEVQCLGDESTITDCAHNGFASHDCDHYQDAGVVCGEYEVRLVNPNSTCSGRVEILNMGEWGTVCGKGWDINDAEVVCRQLGCGKALSADGYALFEQGSGPIWLWDVDCSGSEESISYCQHNQSNSISCAHDRDASIICEEIGFDSNSPDLPPPRSLVRLANSSDSCSGRVEIFYNRQWGTVCDDDWSMEDAHVVCQQLGCGKALSIYDDSYFGNGYGPIWMDDVQCSGDELSIADCAHPGFGSHDCDHLEDAGVLCEGYRVRLVNPNSNCSGRVELLHNDQWGTVCDDDWGLDEAQVVCNQLGCGKALSANGDALFGAGSGPIWLDNLECSGSERSIKDCQHNGMSSHNCDHSEDSSVICEEIGFDSNSPDLPPPSSLVRLVGSDSSCSGRVEVFYNRQWGTVCDDNWGMEEARVICQQMGCGKALSAHDNAYFGEGFGPIWMDNVECSGNESSVTDCQHRGFGSHNCHHNEDASVICEGVLVRLVSPYSNCSGRVEILHNGHWGILCDDDWELQDAEVVCQQLGCGKALSTHEDPVLLKDIGSVWLDDVKCSGDESSVKDCANDGFGSHSCRISSVTCEDAMVQSAFRGLPPPSAPVRLMGSKSRCSGRVEILHNGQWGTVCDDNWGLDEAQVVCQQLGCGRLAANPHAAHFGEGSGIMWIENAHCSGSESSITECALAGYMSNYCVHKEAASVICEDHHPHVHVSKLTCSHDQMKVGVSLASLQFSGLDSSSGHLSVPDCSSPTMQDDALWYVVPRQAGVCGNIMMTNNTHAIYSNSLFFYPLKKDPNDPPEIIPFSCAYPLETDISMKPVEQKPMEGSLMGSGTRVTASMYLFQSSSYTRSYPAGSVTLPMGSALYVGVFVSERDPSFALVLEDCYTTYSSNPDEGGAEPGFLIQNRCSTDPQHVTVVDSGNALSARFSAEIFPLNPGLFLHCKLSLCDKRYDSCSPLCGNRGYLSVSNESPLPPLTLGPISWI